MNRVVVALYDNLDDARMAVEELIREGYPHGDISLVTRDESGEYSRYIGEIKVEEGTESALAGAGVGAAIGGIGGLLLGLGALAIPGIGPIIAAGPIAAALAGAATGAVVGGILGALLEVGIPEEEAKYFAQGVERGGTLVTVNTSADMASRARDILNRHNPSDLYSHEMSSVVATDFVEYEPTFRSDFDRNFAYTGRSWDVYRPAYYYGYELASDERYRGRTWSEIEADARRDWEVRYGDTLWDDIKDAVRSAWDTITGKSVDTDFYQYEPTFRAEYDMNYANTGRSWDIYRPAYYYGYELASDERYRGRTWSDIEADARRDWDQRYGDTLWDDIKDAVRSAWDTITGILSGTDFDQYEPTFRSDYDRNYAYTGRSWDIYRPAYYYGYELASDERYRGRTWSDIEADARRDWDQRYGDTLWDDIKDAVRSAWDTITGRR